MSRSRHSIAFFLAWGAAVVSAAPAIAGSAYSIGGLGEPSLEESARLRGIGGAGAGEHGARTFSLVNPASVAEVEHLVLEGTILPTMRRVDAVSLDETAYETAFPSARALIRLPGRIVLGGAYLVGTNARFSIERPESSGTASTLRIDGTGGIDLIRVTLARRVNPSVNLGIDYEVIAGSYREDWTRVFADPSFTTTRDTLETAYERRGRWRFGGQLYRGGWTIGGVYETARRLPLTFTQRTGGTLVRQEHQSLRIPSGLALGFTGPAAKRLRIAGQYRRASWNNESLVSDLVDFRALERWSFGVERTSSFDEGGFFNRLPLRLGASYLRWPDILPLAGSTGVQGGGVEVNEWVLSLGTGIRTQDKGGSIDLALEAGTRGDREALGLSERFLRLAISLQVSDDTWK